MKSVLNGGLQLSVLDGWWDEGYDGDNGWAIGGREVLPDESAQDWQDALDLYRLLEDEIVPRYYDTDAEGIPRRWLAVMRRAMATALWQFSATRMLHEYTEQLYLPAAGVPVLKSERAPLLTEAG
jgi:starch phosphorylase